MLVREKQPSSIYRWLDWLMELVSCQATFPFEHLSTILSVHIDGWRTDRLILLSNAFDVEKHAWRNMAFQMLEADGIKLLDQIFLMDLRIGFSYRLPINLCRYLAGLVISSIYIYIWMRWKLMNYILQNVYRKCMVNEYINRFTIWTQHPPPHKRLSPPFSIWSRHSAWATHILHIHK